MLWAVRSGRCRFSLSSTPSLGGDLIQKMHRGQTGEGRPNEEGVNPCFIIPAPLSLAHSLSAAPFARCFKW